jgi:hypothetical protein
MFIQIQDGAPIGHAVVEDNLKALFPSAVFPSIYTPEFAAQLGYGMYEWTQIPEVQYPNKLVEFTPTKRENGIYYQTWGIEQMTAAEQAEATASKVEEQRMVRNMRLMQSDWTQLSDVSLSAEKKAQWNAHRQALRDVPTQVGFPWDIQWPTQPE